MALIDLNKILKTGTAAFDTLKSGGTTKAALEAANRTYQSKPGDSSSSSSKSSNILSNPLKAVSTPTIDIINGVTAANKAAQTPTPITPSQALAQGKGPIASTVAQPIIQQPVQQVPQVDPNLATQIQDLIKALQQNNQPKAIPQYQSQYSDDIAQAINQFNSRPDFKFDATNNPTIEANKKLIGDSVTQEMGRRNILNSTITGDRMTEDIATMVNTVLPQLQQQAYGQYQDEGQNILQHLQNFQNLDQNDYNKYINSYNMGQDANQNQFSNTMSIANLLDSLDTKNFNKTQTEKDNARQDSQITGYLNPYAGQTISPDVAKYSSNYAQYAKDFANDNDPSNDALIPELEKASVLKMFSDPSLLEKYGDKYKTLERKAQEANAEFERQKLIIEAEGNNLETQLKLAELAKKQEEVNQLVKYGGAEAEAKIDQIRASANASNASASASKASATASYALASQRNRENTVNTNGFTEDQQKYIDYNEELQTIKQYPDTAVQTIKENKKALMDYYGIDKYDDLLKEAEALYKQYGSKSPVYRQF